MKGTEIHIILTNLTIYGIIIYWRGKSENILESNNYYFDKATKNL